MRKSPATFLAASLLLVLIRPAAAQFLTGTAAIEQALERLNVLGSVLMIAAHPDDENTAVLAWCARGQHFRTGYLSATRGEGGQNLIGPEQGDLLGLIRTRELLAARQIDGAEQFFTRAIDFGYTKSADETLAKWGREKVLSDMVWIIRRYRPDVIILRFSGTPRDGHGQHQASAILGKEAYFAAADPSRFPEQLKQVRSWKTTRLLFNVFSFTAEQERAAAAVPGRIEIDAGAFDPVLGRSYNEIAGISRSQHQSQGFGAPQRRGPARNYFTVIDGPPAKGLLDRVDTTWNRLPGGAPVGRILEEALRAFDPGRPDKVIPLLLRARPLIAALRDPWAERKLRELDETVALCGGLWVDADAQRAFAVPGASLQVRLTAINRSAFPFGAAEYHMRNNTGSMSASLPENQPVTASVELAIPPAEPYTQPFWLALPHQGDAYDIPDPMLIGRADALPYATARFRFTAGDQLIELARPVHHRYVDRVWGEKTRAFAVVPPVAVNLPERVLLFPDAEPRRLHVQVQANASETAGELRLGLPPGWKADPDSRPFRIGEAGEGQELTFDLTPPATDAQVSFSATATVNGRQIGSGMDVIAYPHIPPQTVFPPAQGRFVRADVKVLARRIGYIMGAGDRMPEALRQLGCAVTLLTAADLEQGDLSAFDAVVTGVRAYNVRPDLRANQPRLLAYVSGGGTLIVQYNVFEGALPNLGPFPLSQGRDRVSVEDAPVTFPSPDHPLLRRPNRITARDFEGWVQERGLYFASQWDPRYQPVLESHDPGEPARPGGMLYARCGKGVYIFTAYSWFRQLPAGVPGAYRLFANMLSAGKQ